MFKRAKEILSTLSISPYKTNSYEVIKDNIREYHTSNGMCDIADINELTFVCGGTLDDSITNKFKESQCNFLEYENNLYKYTLNKNCECIKKRIKRICCNFFDENSRILYIYNHMIELDILYKIYKDTNIVESFKLNKDDRFKALRLLDESTSNMQKVIDMYTEFVDKYDYTFIYDSREYGTIFSTHPSTTIIEKSQKSISIEIDYENQNDAIKKHSYLIYRLSETCFLIVGSMRCVNKINQLITERYSEIIPINKINNDLVKDLQICTVGDFFINSLLAHKRIIFNIDEADIILDYPSKVNMLFEDALIKIKYNNFIIRMSARLSFSSVNILEGNRILPESEKTKIRNNRMSSTLKKILKLAKEIT